VKRIRAHCFAQLESFKVPVKIRIVEHDRVTERFKKARGTAATSGGNATAAPEGTKTP